MATRLLLSDARSVRDEHGRMFRSLNRQLGIHKHGLNAEGWRLLTRAAFSLYLDSLDRQLPLTQLFQQRLDFPARLGGVGLADQNVHAFDVELLEPPRQFVARFLLDCVALL